MISDILYIVMTVVVLIGMLKTLRPEPPKPDYKRIEALERELELEPPFISEYPEIKKPTKIERVW